MKFKGFGFTALLPALAALAFASACKEGEAPDTWIESGPAPLTRSQFLTFEFTSDAQDATFRCRIDAGAVQPCLSPAEVNIDEDGPHTFEVYAVADGISDLTPAVHTWVSDLTLPVTTITGHPMGTVNTAVATFYFNASEPGARFRCKLDGGAYEDCQSGKTYGQLPDGPHSFTVFAIDRAGNEEESPVSVAWTIDAPNPIVTLMGPETGVSGPFAAFTIAVVNTSSIECRIDGIVNICGPGTGTYGPFASGAHQFTVKATSHNGEVASTTWQWIVDAAGPVITIVPPEGGATGSAGVIALSVTDDNSPVQLVCALDGTGVVCSEMGFTFAGLAPGSHELVVQAFDVFENASTASLTWTVE